MSSSLELSKRLRALTDEQLSELASTRLTNSTAIKDYFDLADALLTEDSILSAVRRLPLEQLLQLRELASTGKTAANAELTSTLEQALLGSEGKKLELYPEVSAVILSATENLVPATADKPSKPEKGSELRDVAALETALSAITSLDELARSIESHHVKELARGGLSAQDSQRLAPLMPSAEITPTALLALGKLSGILAKNSGWWMATEKLDDWLHLPLAERWLAVTTAWSEHLGTHLQKILSTESNWGPELHAWLEVHYPLGHDWLDGDLKERLSEAELLGLSHAGTVTAVGREVLAGNWKAVTAAITAVVPPFTEHVFVQHDFTVVAPGPLTPADDVFMRQLCVVESRGLATTFRITAQGTNHLLAQGTSAQQILDHLTALAATDIPQAVSYFITDLGERFGTIRVREVNGNTVVKAQDLLVLRTINADHSLHSLGLRPVSEDSLQTAISAGIVLNALLDAKYPAQLEDASGKIIAAPVHRRSIELQPEPVSPHVALVQRLRGSREAATTDDATWIARQLDVAVREKSILVVTVSMPDGEREFTIEPKGFSNGRLRCLDRTTEVERTLPASHITAVRPA
ncbi:hypothetical protein M2113_000950 [Aurantimicrobium minutum]|uniref:helicase-associated domain-containing protein n=1 Tax=Aurantimicrobium minutum TaxID=708131 RepID=UPI0024736D19|nr:helicase-associated domain-containing protein [Aurantimicrobium minutum]MDH6409989.1 hypothetical protein [Aurantimicrobium minutum]